MAAGDCDWSDWDEDFDTFTTNNSVPTISNIASRITTGHEESFSNQNESTAADESEEEESDIEMFDDNCHSETAATANLSRNDQLLTTLSLLEDLPAPGFNFTADPNGTQKLSMPYQPEANSGNSTDLLCSDPLPQVEIPGPARNFPLSKDNTPKEYFQLFYPPEFIQEVSVLIRPFE